MCNQIVEKDHVYVICQSGESPEVLLLHAASQRRGVSGVDYSCTARVKSALRPERRSYFRETGVDGERIRVFFSEGV